MALTFAFVLFVCLVLASFAASLRPTRRLVEAFGSDIVDDGVDEPAVAYEPPGDEVVVDGAAVEQDPAGGITYDGQLYEIPDEDGEDVAADADDGEVVVLTLAGDEGIAAAGPQSAPTPERAQAA
jgi:hypothetical protein